jgi:hypothetical protein
MTAAVNFFYLFPDGRFVPRATRLMTCVSLLWGLAWVLFPTSPFNLSDPYRLPVLSFAALMGWWGLGIGAQLYRYRRVAGPVQRLQTKWVLSAVAIAVAGYLAFGFDRFVVPVLWQSHAAGVVYDLVGVPLFLLTVLTIPVAFAVSILRYRLWEIDVIINRALVYVALTAILGGLYTASITLSQRLFVALTGEKSDAAIVLTTLIVASAFTQVKSSLQSLAERRLKHDPDPTRGVRELAERVRASVEVFDVEEMMRKVLQESVGSFNATGGAVCLGRDGQFRLKYVHGDWTQVEGMSAWLVSGDTCYGWVALGPRRNGVEYAEQDRALFAQVAAAAALAVQTLERVGLGVFAPTFAPINAAHAGARSTG